MNVDSIRRFCLSLPEASENLQWGETLCFKIRSKIFVTLHLGSVPPQVVLKCAPERFTELLEHEGIVPAPYVGRYQWAMLERLDVLPWKELQALIQQSYAMVAQRATRRKKVSAGAGRTSGRRPAGAHRSKPHLI